MLHTCTFNNFNNFILLKDAEESQSTIDVLAAPLSVCLAEELGEGCEEREGEETANVALTHCLFRLIDVVLSSCIVRSLLTK